MLCDVVYWMNGWNCQVDRMGKIFKIKIKTKIFNAEITINHHHFKSSTVYSVQPLLFLDGDKTVNSVQSFPDV